MLRWSLFICEQKPWSSERPEVSSLLLLPRGNHRDTNYYWVFDEGNEGFNCGVCQFCSSVTLERKRLWMCVSHPCDWSSISERLSDCQSHISVLQLHSFPVKMTTHTLIICSLLLILNGDTLSLHLLFYIYLF